MASSSARCGFAGLSDASLKARRRRVAPATLERRAKEVGVGPPTEYLKVFKNLAYLDLNSMSHITRGRGETAKSNAQLPNRQMKSPAGRESLGRNYRMDGLLVWSRIMIEATW